jgi:hypothetical protein
MLYDSFKYQTLWMETLKKLKEGEEELTEY